MSRPLREVYARQKRPKLSAEQFTAGLNEAGYSVERFAWLTGWRTARIGAWRSGAEDIDDRAELILTALCISDAREALESVARLRAGPPPGDPAKQAEAAKPEV